VSDTPEAAALRVLEAAIGHSFEDESLLEMALTHASRAHEMDAGPREVSPPGSHFPLKVTKGPEDGEVVLYWEDLRTDAMQPRDDGVNPATPAREYTVWQGTIGSYESHAPLAQLVHRFDHTRLRGVEDEQESEKRQVAFIRF